MREYGKVWEAGKARRQPVDAMPLQAVPSVQPANSTWRHQLPTRNIAPSDKTDSFDTLVEVFLTA
ncbi:MAG: hypothetical protein IKD10_10445 [Lentisphaeria bacterium]|nr:hypothetical protein [Lentisphaerota bacterium]MBR7145349.1 hypothetical protein [Lentisphaeria bacterium]